MKSDEIYKMKRAEIEAYTEKMYELLDSLPLEEWIRRMKWMIKHCAQMNTITDGTDWKAELMKFNDYKVEYSKGHMSCIEACYDYYDSITCRLSFTGFSVVFMPEHGENQVLLRVDGLEEFKLMTDNIS